MVSPINGVLESIYLQSRGINALDLKLDLPYPAFLTNRWKVFSRVVADMHILIVKVC